MLELVPNVLRLHLQCNSQVVRRKRKFEFKQRVKCARPRNPKSIHFNLCAYPLWSLSSVQFLCSPYKIHVKHKKLESCEPRKKKRGKKQTAESAEQKPCNPFPSSINILINVSHYNRNVYYIPVNYWQARFCVGGSHHAVVEKKVTESSFRAVACRVTCRCAFLRRRQVLLIDDRKRLPELTV